MQLLDKLRASFRRKSTVTSSLFFIIEYWTHWSSLETRFDHLGSNPSIIPAIDWIRERPSNCLTSSRLWTSITTVRCTWCSFKRSFTLGIRKIHSEESPDHHIDATSKIAIAEQFSAIVWFLPLDANSDLYVKSKEKKPIEMTEFTFFGA